MIQWILLHKDRKKCAVGKCFKISLEKENSFLLSEKVVNFISTPLCMCEIEIRSILQNSPHLFDVVTLILSAVVLVLFGIIIPIICLNYMGNECHYIH